jgi:dimethylhistidine N-methyltransferase
VDLLHEVVAGLSRQPKVLSPKFFYDERGSRLFDAITELPEYYPTRTEIEILRRHGAEIARHLGHGSALIELGSGSPLKIRVLLDSLQPAIYLPVDISAEHLRRSAADIARDYPEIRVEAVCADYSDGLRLPETPPEAPRAAFFPGSSIGNFEPGPALSLLAAVAEELGEDGALLIGVDLKKDPRVLDAAYNDSQGVTAAFNRNLLERINREVGADFAPEQFNHRAFYDPRQGRVEMHLVSEREQQVRLDGRRFGFVAGESIHTENSYKYTVDEFHGLAARAGFTAEQVWTDDEHLFSVHCLRVAG